MNLRWTSNLRTNTEKEEFVNQLRGSPDIIDRLYDICNEEEENLNRLEVSIKAFDSPSWAYQQAYYNGFRACLRMLKKLFTLDQKETNV